eukprot:6098552-Prymnesium_polylepis.1
MHAPGKYPPGTRARGHEPAGDGVSTVRDSTPPLDVSRVTIGPITNLTNQPFLRLAHQPTRWNASLTPGWRRGGALERTRGVYALRTISFFTLAVSDSRG